MARQKKAADPAVCEPVEPTDEVPDEPEAIETDGPQYGNCPCGARLVLEDEIAAGVCEHCGFLWPDGILRATAPPEPGTPERDDLERLENEKANAVAPLSPPSQPSLFPPEPFNEHAALEDIFKKTRAVEAYRKTYEELKQRASDAKKQWESAATLCEEATTAYETKYRAWVEADERQRELVDAYEQVNALTGTSTVGEALVEQAQG